MKLAALYCTSLGEADLRALRERLRSHRVSLFGSLLGSLQKAPVRERLGSHTATLQKFFDEVLSLSHRAPARFAEIVDHWAVTFLLTRILDGNRDAARLDRLMSGLAGLLFCQWMANGARPAGDGTFTTTPELYGFLNDSRIRIRGLGGGPLVWRFSQEEIEVRPSADGGHAIRAPLPMAAGEAVEMVPMPRLAGFDLPVITEPEFLGVDEVQPEMTGAEERADGWRPLPLEESLEEAHRLLSRLWPEIVPWTRELVPAFGDMGGTPSPSVHRSSSYGAATPVLLTKVGDPFEHAEDIAHELQHERLFLMFRPEDFETWSDLRQRYVSPYRRDPRPLRGLFLGLHAFLAVNELRLRAREAGVPGDRDYGIFKTHRMNLFAFRTILEHERFSSSARALFAEIAAALADQHRRIELLASPEMRERFDRYLDAHVASAAAQADEIVNFGARYSSWNETAGLAAAYGA